MDDFTARTQPSKMQQVDAVTKLTALWALSESGLGGILHALHLPFKGLLIAGIAVVLITLIAKYSNYSFNKIAGATIVVLLVKAAVSPHSPPPAYIAVAFQGFLGSALFGFLPSKRAAGILLGILGLAETCAQKFLVATIFFGKSIWQAANGFLKEITSDLPFLHGQNLAFWAVGVYILIYALWGAVVGNYAASLPKKIEKDKEQILDQFAAGHKNMATETPKRKAGRKWRRVLVYSGLLIFIIAVFAFAGAGKARIVAIVLRTLAAVTMMYFIILPLLNFIFDKWIKGRSLKQKQKSQEVLAMLPELRSYMPAALSVAQQEPNFFKRFSKFLSAMAVLTLYGSEVNEKLPNS